MTLYPFLLWALEAKDPNGDDHKTDLIHFKDFNALQIFQCRADYGAWS